MKNTGCGKIPKRQKISSKQAFLSLAFIFVIVLGFGAVALVSESYEADNSEILLWVSDSNTEFEKFYYSDNYEYAEVFNITTSVFRHVTTDTDWQQYEFDPVYLGNNTWGFTATGFPSATYDRIGIRNVIKMPNLDRWIIKRVVINSTAPAEDNDFNVVMFHFTEPFEIGTYGSTVDPTQTSLIHKDLTGDTNELKKDIVVSLTTGMRIWQFSQDTIDHALALGFELDDPQTDGMDTFPYTFTVEIYGQNVEQYDMESVIGWTLIGSSVLLIFTAIYMTDQFDIGGYVRDRPYRRSPTKRKSTKRKR